MWRHKCKDCLCQRWSHSKGEILLFIMCQIQINSYLIHYWYFYLICLFKLYLVLSSPVLNTFLSRFVVGKHIRVMCLPNPPPPHPQPPVLIVTLTCLQKHTDTHQAPLDDGRTPALLRDTDSTSWFGCWLIPINWYTDRSSLKPLTARQKLRVAFGAVIEPANDDISAWKSRSSALQLINNISG